MRGLVLAAAMVLASGAVAVPAQQPMSQNERAYTITLICAVLAANGRNDADIQRTINAVRKVGTTMGYSNKKVSSDLGTMASVVGVQMRDEPATVDRNRGVCRQLGLLS